MTVSDSETASENEDDYQPQKKRKLNTVDEVGSRSLERQGSISPPLLRRANDARIPKQITTSPSSTVPTLLPSPFQLTHIKDLPDHLNVDAVKLHDILGDPLIKECWQFNFLIDLDFLM